MSRIIPRNAVLVPTPSHNGNATTTLLLANEIARITGRPVADVLKGKVRDRQYDAKKKGSTLTAGDMGIAMKGTLPKGVVPIVIDNVIATGNTAKACLDALGKGMVVALADDDTSKDRLLDIKKIRTSNKTRITSMGNIAG